MQFQQSFRIGAVASAVFVLAACGGGGGSGSASAPASAPVASGASLSGTSYKGPTAGATVCAYQIDNTAAGKKGAKVVAQEGSTASIADGCVVTANDGTYKFVLPAGTTSDLVIESTGGTYCTDESVFNGTACAGGGTPVAMGVNALRTVATPGAGAVDAPLTLLTTAAADKAATLSASTFKAAYETVATNFGLTDKSPTAAPNSPALEMALYKLADYLGNDSALLGGLVASIAGDKVTAQGGTISAQAAVQCSALASTDMTAVVPFPMPGGMGPPMTMYMPVPAGMLSGCVDSADGLTSSSIRYQFSNGMSSIFTAEGGGGMYTERRYTGACANPQRTELPNMRATNFWMKANDPQALTLSATTDPARSQSGTALRLTVALNALNATQAAQPGAEVQKHLFCRTRASSATSPLFFEGYFTSPDSPLRDGSRSRFDIKSPFTGGQNG